MTRFSLLAAAAVLVGGHTLACAQGASERSGGGEGPPRQCWDSATGQLRQRSAADETAGRGSASVKEPADGVAGESGSSEGMAGLPPGSKGSASAIAAAEEAAPTGRPPGMPDC